MPDTAAFGEPAPAPPTVGVTSLEQVVDNLRLWVFGLIAAVATLYLTFGAVRLMTANGKPEEIEKGWSSIRSAMIGYAFAIFSPVVVTIVGSWLV
jgi:hypothetical protein